MPFLDGNELQYLLRVLAVDFHPIAQLLTSISNTVSHGATKALVLNIEKANTSNCSKEFEAQCIGYFLCDSSLKT